MAKNRFIIQPKQMGLAMSPSYSHTVNAAPALSPDDEDDGDICPVCDGECTCNNSHLPLRPPTPPSAVAKPSGPLSMEELSRQFSSATSSSTPSFLVPKQPQRPPPPPSRPSLKIKLALPASMLAKRHASQEAGSSSSSSHKKYRNHDETMFVDGNAGEHYAYIGPSSTAGASTPTPSHPYTSHPSSHHPPQPRKRGRPRKNVPSARDPSPDSRRDSTSPVQRRTNPKTHIIGRQKQQIYAQKFAKTLKARAPAPKKSKKAAIPKRRRPTNAGSSLSDLTDDEYGEHSRAYYPDSEDDTASVQFPTFVSASALSSMESGADGHSSDSSSSLSDFDSDSSIKEEEEDFMVSEMQHDKASVRRKISNEWVIKPRRKSVGLSDAEVDMDSDATEDEDDDNEEAQRTIIADPSPCAPEVDEGEETDGRHGPSQGNPKGLVTCWSDEESDSFDADVFFANLSSDSDSTDDEAKESGGNLMEDDDDETASDVSTEAELMHMREELENLPLELAESWDGQLMFTNGTLGGQAIIDIDFEVNASQFITEPNPNTCRRGGECGSPSHNHCMSHDGDSDVEMSAVDDGGYEEDSGEGVGDTTDEELVGEDDLPNERAMRLFNFPLSVSSINPLSTVSPAVTPASKRPGPRNFDSSNRLQSPSPADILAGKMGWDSADEMDELFDSAQRGRRLVRGDGTRSEENSPFSGPRKGVFVPAHETRQVVIDGTQKEVPSPHPRFNRRRARRFNTVEALLRKHLLSIARNPSSFIPAATVVPNSSPLKLLPSVEISAASSSAATGLLTPGSAPQPSDDGLTAAIDLDDVFESSFFNPDPSEVSGSSINRIESSPADAPPDSATADESDTNRNEMKHLHRWDVISVGAFRQTRESVSGILDSPTTPGWSDHRRTPASSTDYGNVLKTGPLSTMLWPTGEKKKGSSSSRRIGSSSAALGVSPLILPTSGDGDRTPTGHSHQQQRDGNKQQQQNGYTPKTRRELRKEKKSKKKYGNSPHGNHHPAHQYHSHHHHPNSKSRGGAQRTNFFLSSVPPLNI